MAETNNGSDMMQKYQWLMDKLGFGETKEAELAEGASAEEQQSYLANALKEMPGGVQLAAAMDGMGLDMSKTQDDGSYTVSGDSVAYAEGRNLGVVDKDGNLDMDAAMEYLNTDYADYTPEQQEKLGYVLDANKQIAAFALTKDGTPALETEDGQKLGDYLTNMDGVDDVQNFQDMDVFSKMVKGSSLVEGAMSNMDTVSNMDVSLDARTMLQYGQYQNMLQAAKDGTLTPDKMQEYSDRMTEIGAMTDDQISDLLADQSEVQEVQGEIGSEQSVSDERNNDGIDYSDRNNGGADYSDRNDDVKDYSDRNDDVKDYSGRNDDVKDYSDRNNGGPDWSTRNDNMPDMSERNNLSNDGADVLRTGFVAGSFDKNVQDEPSLDADLAPTEEITGVISDDGSGKEDGMMEDAGRSSFNVRPYDKLIDAPESEQSDINVTIQLDDSAVKYMAEHDVSLTDLVKGEMNQGVDFNTPDLDAGDGIMPFDLQREVTAMDLEQAGGFDTLEYDQSDKPVNQALPLDKSTKNYGAEAEAKFGDIEKAADQAAMGFDMDMEA